MGACQQQISKDETAVTLPLLQAIKRELMFNLESARLHDCAGHTYQKADEIIDRKERGTSPGISRLLADGS
jgi:hypothetical protein